MCVGGGLRRRRVCWRVGVLVFKYSFQTHPSLPNLVSVDKIF